MAIDQIPANRRLVEELHAHGYLTAAARHAALEFLRPRDQWGVWIARLLLVVGSALTLSGVVWFFDYNWSEIPPIAKLVAIQFGVVAAVGASCRCGLTRTSGKALMVGASVLVGVFLTVFGEVYRTGADAYELFIVWSLLIFGWSVISNSAPQWVLWLAVTNIALNDLWSSRWSPAALPIGDSMLLVYASQALFTGAALAVRERGAMRGVDWMTPRWTRMLLALVTLGSLLVPAATLILASDTTTWTLVTGLIGLIGHVVFYTVYRWVLRDAWALSATALSGCLILEAAAYRILREVFGATTAAFWLGLGLATLFIFGAAMAYLRSIARELRPGHG